VNYLVILIIQCPNIKIYIITYRNSVVFKYHQIFSEAVTCHDWGHHKIHWQAERHQAAWVSSVKIDNIYKALILNTETNIRRMNKQIRKNQCVHWTSQVKFHEFFLNFSIQLCTCCTHFIYQEAQLAIPPVPFIIIKYNRLPIGCKIWEPLHSSDYYWSQMVYEWKENDEMGSLNWVIQSPHHDYLFLW